MAKKKGTNNFLDAEPVSAKKGKNGTRSPEKARQGEVRVPRQKEKTVSGKPAERPKAAARQAAEQNLSQSRRPQETGRSQARPKAEGAKSRAEAPRARGSQVSAGTGRSRLAQEDSWASRRVESSPARPAREKPLRRMEEEPDLPIKKRRRMSGRGVMILLLTIVLLGGLGFLGYKYIRAEQIIVRGNQKLSSEYIIGLSGIKTGTHVFNVNKDLAKAGVEADPYLTLEGIEYTFPNTITLVVSERQGTACFEFRGAYVVTDSTGFILESCMEKDRPDLPIIEGINVTEFALGAKIRTDDTYKQDIMTTLLETFAQYNMTDKIARMDLEDVNSITLVLKNGMNANFGQADKIEEKLAWLANILPVLESEGKTGGTIDISSVDMPIYVPPEGTAEPATTTNPTEPAASPAVSPVPDDPAPSDSPQPEE